MEEAQFVNSMAVRTSMAIFRIHNTQEFTFECYDLRPVDGHLFFVIFFQYCIAVINISLQLLVFD